MITQRTSGYVSAPFWLLVSFFFFLLPLVINPAFPGVVFALLWRNTLHTKEAPDQHGSGREKRFTQAQVPPPTQDQRILGNCSKPARNWWAARLFCMDLQLKWFSRLTGLMRLVQPQPCTTPTWTSETTRHHLSSTFWTGKNITRTYMWGRDNVLVFFFGFQYCDIRLPSWGICSWLWEILLPLSVTGEYRWRRYQKMRRSVLPGSTNSIRRRLERVIDVRDTQLSGGN